AVSAPGGTAPVTSRQASGLSGTSGASGHRPTMAPPTMTPPMIMPRPAAGSAPRSSSSAPAHPRPLIRLDGSALPHVLDDMADGQVLCAQMSLQALTRVQHRLGVQVGLLPPASG